MDKQQYIIALTVYCRMKCNYRIGHPVLLIWELNMVDDLNCKVFLLHKLRILILVSFFLIVVTA